MNIGRAIRVARQAKGMKQAELAEKAKISKGMVSLLETNRRAMSLKMLDCLAEGLDMPLSLLVMLACDEGELDWLGESEKEKVEVAIIRWLKKGWAAHDLPVD